MRNRSAIIGYALLTLILTAGAAQGLTGVDTVFTDDIVAGAVTTPDIRDDAVTSGKIKTGAVFGSDIADNAVGTAEVSDGSLTAADVAKAKGDTVKDFASISAFSCAGSAINVGFEPAGDVIVGSPSEEIDNNGKLVISFQDSNSADVIVVNACNVTASAIDPPAATIHWMIFDN